MTVTQYPDFAPITRHLRAMYSSRLLLAAVHHLHVFELLQHGPLPVADLQRQTGLADRPAAVLFPALCAMELLTRTADDELALTAVGHHLTLSASPTITGYTGLEANNPGVLEMTDRLRNDGPLQTDDGIAYVKEGEGPSPMDDPDTARTLTLALAGRAKALSPIVAANLPRHSGHLLDVAGGSGYFTYEWLLANPDATATLFDREAVLTVADELLTGFSQSGRPGAETVRERVTFLPGDMLTDPLPETDLLLAASLFHDWPEDTCQLLADRFAGALRSGGELWVHDAFLNDTLDGPLPVTDYSAQLFWVTKGRCYSRAEYRKWFRRAGLTTPDETIPTQMDYSLIRALKN